MINQEFKFNKEKTLNVILYIAKKLKRSDFHKIFKILYFADRDYLVEYGFPITGDTYIAMEAGPVPSKVYDIFKIVRGDSYISDTENLSSLFSVENWMYIHPIKEADIRKIAPAEKRIIDKCLLEYGDLSYAEIKEKSHDIAWKSTARDYTISIENIGREAGLKADELDYVKEMQSLKNSLS